MDKWQALVNMVMTLQMPSNVGKFLTSSETIFISRKTNNQHTAYKMIQLLEKGMTKNLVESNKKLRKL
jgi:hypothetical protein